MLFLNKPVKNNKFNLYGNLPIEGNSKTFFEEWDTWVNAKGIAVVGRKDNAPGTFSLIPHWREGYDIAYYKTATPEEVCSYISDKGPILTAQHFRSNPKYECLYQDLSEILEMV
jgi:hypothetical protein